MVTKNNARISLPLSGDTGESYWRSLDQLTNSPEFQRFLENEFPSQLDKYNSGGMSRRNFLKIMAASFALAGLQGCRRPEIPNLPYVESPENVTPGLPTFYATTIPRTGSSFPILVETHEGRPTKIEGNPKHSFSQGKTDLFAQAAILDLYDPDRSKQVKHNGRSSSWQAFDDFAASHFAELRNNSGRGFHILSDGFTSPSIRLLQDHLRNALPEAIWHSYQPISRENELFGAELTFGQRCRSFPDYSRADVVLSLDDNFLGVDLEAAPKIRGFMEKRRVTSDTETINRLYAVESTMSATGGFADHRLQLPAKKIGEFAFQLALALGIPGMLGDNENNLQRLLTDKASLNIPDAWVTEIARHLTRNQGRSIITAGINQPPLVHLLVNLMNETLGNRGATISWYDVPETTPSSLQNLVEAAEANEVRTLLILGGNPSYNAPFDVSFSEKIRNVPTKIRLGSYEDETSEGCTWHLPESHFLESWGDAETVDGTYSPVQPMIAPLFGGRSGLQLLAQISNYEFTEPFEIVRRAFNSRRPNPSQAFNRFLHDGYLEGSRNQALQLQLTENVSTRLISALNDYQVTSVDSENLELTFHADASVYDGRFSNNGWLQEVPDPITKLTWDNAALISPQTAQHFHLNSGDVIRITSNRSLEIPVFILPGQSDWSIAVSLGYGRTRAGRIGNAVGSNAYTIRKSTSPFCELGISIQKTGRTQTLASTQNHWSMEGRDLIREEPISSLLSHDDHHSGDRHNSHNGEHHPNIAEAPELDGRHQWGMAIDLNQCVGCNACVVACQSENNVPIVGKDEVSRGRAMHWIRVDRYFKGEPEDPQMVYQPVACVHCENAPCETVCPVNAAVHSPEGLNLQVYNRCIGTRYCSNNCPYKVRRFNWFDYSQTPLNQLRLGPLADHGMPETLKMQKNPDVTVRMRGVMEKCTYCVQRIERAKAGARLQSPGQPDYDLPDGAVTSACAQACPAKAIVFGDLSDPQSKVSRIKDEQRQRNYDLLGELNTKPRTSYLSRVRNQNPALVAALRTNRMGGADD